MASARPPSYSQHPTLVILPLPVLSHTYIQVGARYLARAQIPLPSALRRKDGPHLVDQQKRARATRAQVHCARRLARGPGRVEAGGVGVAFPNEEYIPHEICEVLATSNEDSRHQDVHKTTDLI